MLGIMRSDRPLLGAGKKHMYCPHCTNENPKDRPYDRPMEGGQAFAQVCAACGHILDLRRRQAGDPPVIPAELDTSELARLRFLRWRLDPAHEGRPAPGDTPPHAA